MKRFGYLAEGTANTEALHTEESITEAVRQMQVFGGIHPSGKLDEETLKVSSQSISNGLIKELFCFSCYPNPDVETKIPLTLITPRGGSKDT